jgi:NADH:ubiquinone oxidoreductase subunit 4 (subunit M)
LASLSVVLVPAFMLQLLHRISYGSFTVHMPIITSDITRKEFHIFFPLLGFTIGLGVYPQLLFNDILLPSMALITG